jgi:hypothetical protein
MRRRNAKAEDEKRKKSSNGDTARWQRRGKDEGIRGWNGEALR